MTAFLDPHFNPDVFVSYSHGDPRGAGDSPLKQWTHALIRKLEGQILALDDEFDDLHIWMDAQIDPTAHLSEELRRKVATSGVLLIVMSKRYLKSAWCRDELDWFRNQIRDRAGDVGRVFVLRVQPTETESWPDFLRDERGHAMPGFTFHDPGDITPWGWPDLREMDRDCVKELCRLQTALTKRLRELRLRAAKRAEAEAAVAAAAAPALQALSGPHRIFLHAPTAAEPERIDIGRILSQDGILSMTTKADPGGGLAGWQRDATMRMETAKRCEALALLRTEDAGDRFVGDLVDIGVDERERIANARGTPLPCAVLDKTGGELPIDGSMFGIEHFDVNRPNWRGQFREWLDAARRGNADARP